MIRVDTRTKEVPLSPGCQTIAGANRFRRAWKIAAFLSGVCSLICDAAFLSRKRRR